MPLAICCRLAMAAVFMVAMVGWLPRAAAQSQPPASAGKSPAPVAAPGDLPRALKEAADSLAKEVAALAAQTTVAEKASAQAEKELQEHQAAAAALKASLALKKTPLPEIEAAAKTYAQQESRLEQRLKDLARERETLEKERAAREAAQASLLEHVAQLIAARTPEARARGLQQSYQRYQKLTTEQKQEETRLAALRQKLVQTLEKDKALAAEIQADLKGYLEEVWKAELLKREEPRSLAERLRLLVHTLLGLPTQAYQRFGEALHSGALTAFLRARAAPLVGLMVFFLLLVWGSRKLGKSLLSHIAAWRGRATGRGLRALLSVGEIILSHLLLLDLIFWAVLAMAILGWLQEPAGKFALFVLLTLGAWRLGAHLTQAAFAGEAKGGFLPLDESTARFYRRSLQLFWLYLLAGVLLLTGAELLEPESAGRQLLGYLFQVGLLGWALWLLRKPYLAHLLPELPGPAWLKRLGAMRLLRLLVLLVLGFVILADLVGFHNLSAYAAQAAALSGTVLILGWLTWIGVGKFLRHLLHPEAGWAGRRFPEQEEWLARAHRLARQGAAILVGGLLLLGIVQAWGLKPEQLFWTVSWLAWGPSLGPLKLTPLNLAGAALVIYLGLWSSRFGRTLLEIRVFPRTEWDQGVQYTISTTLHYSILIITILLALNVVGFPLTNLALVAGALGVGIGFGLQNIVNNFISGLILLFERPIKVGDLLVIDGQWGRVKEIRVRSTIFQTAERAVLIIPNSEMLSSKIVNWTHYGWGTVRLSLEVGVSYGADVQEVAGILQEVCRANPRVVADPEPQVFFRAFGDSALMFTVWAYLESPEDRIGATHELNSAIFAALKQRGIGIPYPQRELTIKNWPGWPAPMPGEKG